MTRTIIVSGGAGFRSGDAGVELDRAVLSRLGKRAPRVCYVATASGDAQQFVNSFYDTLGKHCVPSHLSTFLPAYTSPSEALIGQDLIYVDGGNTVSLLAVWRAHGIDRVLLQAMNSGTVLYGHSSGGLCWFEGGTSGSVGLTQEIDILSDGLGFLTGSHCPHFDDEHRRDHYINAVSQGRLPPGIAVEEYAVAQFVDGRPVDISQDAHHRSYFVSRSGVEPLHRPKG